MKRPTIRTLADFQGWCKPDELTGCLVMPGKIHKGSVYVWIKAAGRAVPVSSALALLSGAKLGKGQTLIPRCGNPACAEMTHRFVGTRSDLMKVVRPTLSPQHRMRIAAAHRARDESKYSPELRADIKNSDESCVALGEKLGLHQSVIWRIRMGRTWRETAPAASVFSMA